MYQHSLRHRQLPAQAAFGAQATDADANSATMQALSATRNHIIVDSGASFHMTGAGHHLHDTSPCDRRVVFANGKSSVATTMGKLNFKTPCGKAIALSDVLLTEGMPMTLMSIPALMSANPEVNVQFQKGTCTIYCGKTQVAIASLMPDQRLYVLKGTCGTDYANATLEDITSLWHHRIDHLPIDALWFCARAGLGLPHNSRHQRVHAWTAPGPKCTASAHP
ncbi:hypothetical protein DYB32_006790 [Aphanomyces invadans]|uniref:Retrovirus-related Pol polyprotein from transposon TNT 1-94-like beta-barrel domain-containing protein n=1 Tax=Aphanomyces invadans TaxID=157072 RepID=A0A418AQF3_9STRA|nr:hypothetical protein DYB32_006790 [Aphanomyces invadans]